MVRPALRGCRGEPQVERRVRQECRYALAPYKIQPLRVSSDGFAIKGFEGTGIEEIAQNVGIRKSVIYYHFKNKEQILKTLLDDFVDRGVAFKKSFFERYAESFMENLDVIMEEMIEFMEKNGRIVTILLMESIKNPHQVPLLDLWNFQSPAAQEVVASAVAHHIDTVKAFDKDLEGMHEAFFMLSLPLMLSQ